MKVSDVGSSLFLMGLGGFAAFEASKLSIGTPRTPAPGFFPFYMGLFLIVVAVPLLAEGLKGEPALPEKDLRCGRVILGIVSLFAYPFILEPLGYILSTFLLIAFLLRILVKKAWWFSPAVALLISSFTYVLFKIWLDVLLPKGIFGF